MLVPTTNIKLFKFNKKKCKHLGTWYFYNNSVVMKICSLLILNN